MVYQIKLLLIVLAVAAIAAFCARAAFRDLLSPKQYRTAWNIIGLVAAVTFMARYPALFILGVGACGFIAGRMLGADYKARIAAFFLLVLIFPSISYSLEGFGDINSLLSMNHVRMLSLVLLVPTAVELLMRRRGRERNPFLVIDLLVIGYQFLFVVLNAKYLSSTSILRMLVEIFLEVGIPYYVTSRGIRSIVDLRFVVTHFVLGCIYIASIGVAESATQRLMYSPLQYIYGIRWQLSQSLMRGGMLRVQATTPEPIILAFTLIAGVGMWTWLSDRNWRRPVNLAVTTVFLLAILSTWSRGPWLGMALFAISMIALRWCSVRTYALGLIALLLVGLGIKASGEDEIIYEALRSLFGSSQADFGTIEYRRQLLDAALALIKQSPALGVPNYMSYLQDFKQGEGIVDLVNTYLIVALNAGLIGLVIYVMPTLIIVVRMLRALKTTLPGTEVDPFLPAFISMNIACAFTALTTSTFSVMPFVFLLLLIAPLAYLRYRGEVAQAGVAAPPMTALERFAQFGVTRRG